MRQKNTLEQILEEKKILIIDGSMGTLLEQKGCSLNDKLWTALALANQPELVKEVHLDYFKAGADCGITCSYQATIPGLMNKGYSREEAEQLIVRSVRLFQDAREEWWNQEGKLQSRVYPLCLAGIGPYGAYLADGSEYTGNYTVSDEELIQFHQRRAELLWEAGADYLLFETQPSLHEALLEAEIAEEMGADYWVTFSCKDERHICDGTEIAHCAEVFSENHQHLKCIGVNCTAPKYVASLINELKKHTNLPIAVYPNSGEQYDPVEKVWFGAQNALPFQDYTYTYMQAGAAAVGGCCTTVPEHIENVVKKRDEFLKGPKYIKARPNH